LAPNIGNLIITYNMKRMLFN